MKPLLFRLVALWLCCLPALVAADVSVAVEPPVEVVDENKSGKEESKNIALFKLKEDVAASRSSSLGGNAVTILAGLAGVLILIAALAWTSKRLNLNLPGSSSDLKMVSAMSVGQKEKIMLVEVDGSRLLIGVTSQQINVLKQIETDTQPASKNDFSQKMQTLLKAGEAQDA